MITKIDPAQIDREIRHLGPDDILAAVSISNVTRALSARDYALAEKLNELITALNVSVEPVPIVLPRISLPTLASEVVGNFRIPPGYSATIVDASVASIPTAASAILEVSYSAGTYGQDGAGLGVTKLVTTTGSYTAQGEYVGEGELIFRLTSTAIARVTVSASVLLSLKKD